MKLPVLDTYAFPVTLPSTGKTINMRPYLVREEKLLLMAQESENYAEQVEAVAQIIRNCTNNEVNPRVAPYFDIEYLLLQLRARSVGEVASPIYICHHTPANETTECGHRNPVAINLTEVPVSNLDTSPEKFILRLSDRFTLRLRYPTVYTVHQLVSAVVNGDEIQSQTFLEAVCDVFDVLDDHATNQTYNFMDYTTEERMEFLEGLSPRNFEELVAFLEDMPTVKTTIEFTCEKCQFTHKIALAGVTDFLG